MNERIKELAIQAGFELQVNCGPLEGEGEIYYAKEFEKFAELLVRECAQKGFDVFDEEPDATGDTARYYVRDKIKEHFGVEE